MRELRALALLAMVAALTACSSPQDKAAKAQEESAKADTQLTEERLRLTKEHEKCVADAGQDEAKLAQCDQILKRIEALQ